MFKTKEGREKAVGGKETTTEEEKERKRGKRAGHKVRMQEVKHQNQQKEGKKQLEKGSGSKRDKF